jgi:hypothetical protein
LSKQIGPEWLAGFEVGRVPLAVVFTSYGDVSGVWKSRSWQEFLRAPELRFDSSLGDMLERHKDFPVMSVACFSNALSDVSVGGGATKQLSFAIKVPQ